MAKPLICLVTPAAQNDNNHASRDAFEDELKNLGRTGNYSPPYYGGYTLAGLQTAASNAVTDAHNNMTAAQPAPAVIVTAGTQATTEVQKILIQNGWTTGPYAIPVIQAVGGGIPPNYEPNITGFLIDASKTAQEQFAKLAANYTKVTVLCDNSNPPSNYAYQVVQAYQSVYFSTVNLNSITYQQLQNNIQVSFMLIPNAYYYNNCGTIAQSVQGANGGKGVPAIYPEREYKKAHTNKTGISVHGHHVPLTYRWAANYADSILDGTMTVLPPFKGAITDED
jgi:hypothetical protein